MNYKIVTEASVDMPENFAKENDITILPIEVNFNGELYPEGLPNDEFYAKMKSTGIIPKTSQPNQYKFETALTPYCNKEDWFVLTIVISSNLAGTIAQAKNAVEAFQKIFGLPVDGVVGNVTWYNLNKAYTSILNTLPKGYEGNNAVLYPGFFLTEGTRDENVKLLQEYINAIKTLKGNGLSVIADIVFNHRMGADDKEEVMATEEMVNNRNVDISEPKLIEAWTKYNFDARNNKYSDFKWNYSHFNGTDWDESGRKNGIFRFSGKHWDQSVDTENGNYDYLMGADVDFNNPVVVEELKKWGKWYLELTGVDAFRLDAIKHIKSSFMADWIKTMKEEKEIKCVGEYWNRNLEILKSYIARTNSTIPLFDVPLHYNLYEASNSCGKYDMARIFDNTLVKELPSLAVTFVDNHDTQPGQSLNSWVQDWFKPQAYALILLRRDGYPCIFYGDYYGIPHNKIPAKKDILEILNSTS